MPTANPITANATLTLGLVRIIINPDAKMHAQPRMFKV